MKNLKFKPLLLVAALAGAATLAAHAQNAPMSPPMTSSSAQETTTAPMPRGGQATPMRGDGGDRAARVEQRAERMQIRVAQRLAALKVKLRLSAAQEGAWDSFTQAVKPTPAELGRMVQARMQMRALTTPERIERLRALRGEVGTALDKRFDATNAFYAQLSPEQQKTFDANAMRWVMGGHGGGERGGMRHHRGHHDRSGPMMERGERQGS